MPGLSSALKGPCPRGSGELAHTLCPAPVSALHLTPPERDRERGQKRESGVQERKKKKTERGRERGEDKVDKGKSKRIRMQRKTTRGEKESSSGLKEQHKRH